MKEDGTTKLTENLVKSMDMVRDPQEEAQVLNTLTLFIYHMPSLGIVDFCKDFKSFRPGEILVLCNVYHIIEEIQFTNGFPGRKDPKVLLGESALMFTLMNFPLLQEAEEEVTQELRNAVQKFLEGNADDLLMNEYNKGSVLSGYFSTCFKKDSKLKTIVGHPKHRMDSTFSTMLIVAEAYSADSVENNV